SRATRAGPPGRSSGLDRPQAHRGEPGHLELHHPNWWRQTMRIRLARRYVVSISVAIGICAVSQIPVLAADDVPRKVVAVTPEQVQWFTLSYYTDGRQRAQLIGDSRQPGPFVSSTPPS